MLKYGYVSYSIAHVNGKYSYCRWHMLKSELMCKAACVLTEVKTLSLPRMDSICHGSQMGETMAAVSLFYIFFIL